MPPHLGDWVLPDFCHKLLCSKPFDLGRANSLVPSNQIVYLDSDVFALAPFDGSFTDKVCFTGNTGVMIYKKNHSQELFDAWRHHTLVLLADIERAELLLLKNPHHFFVEDELILSDLNRMWGMTGRLDTRYNLFVSFDDYRDYKADIPMAPAGPPVFLHIRTTSKYLDKTKIAASFEEINRVIRPYVGDHSSNVVITTKEILESVHNI